MADHPHVLFFHVDNLGLDELSGYSGSLPRRFRSLCQLAG